MRDVNKILIPVATLIVGVLLGFGISNVTNNNSNEVELSDAEYLLELIEEYSYYFDDQELLIDGAFRGIVNALNDPYSVYYNEEEYQKFLEHVNASYAGIGVLMISEGEYSYVYEVFPNSPAEIAGFEVGDRIITVDGTNVVGMSLSEIAGLIKGETGVIREIELSRDSMQELISVSPILGVVSNPTVYHEILEENIGYLTITNFSTPTYDEFLYAY